MSRLSAFLNPVSVEETREVIISKRFVDEDGKPVPFVIRALRQEENEAIVKKCRRMKRMPNGQMQEITDTSELSRRLIVAATVEPDFSDAKLCEHYGVIDPVELPGKMLLAGEFAALSSAITDLSGFGADLSADAKN
jgi:hypothetical protein